MNFDVRAYCERIANAAPERFKLTVDEGGGWWHFSDITSKSDVYTGCDAYDYWAFVGPLADELNVKWFDLFESLGKAEYPGVSNTLLEATFAAVCEKLEAAKEEKKA